MEGGAFERYGEWDRVMGSVIDWDDIPQAPNQYTNIQYDQNEFERNTCTVYMAMWAYSDLTGKEIPKEKRKEIVYKAIEIWLDTSYGRWVNAAVKLVADMMGGVSYVSCIVDSSDYWEAIKRWYSMMSWYGGNAVYNVDRDDDGVVDTNTRGKASYNHAVRYNQRDLQVVDNYSRRETNVYRLPELEKKNHSWQMFYNAYFYIPKYNMPMSNLPAHKSEWVTPSTLQARETEVSKWIADGWDQSKLWRDYTTDDTNEKMLIDLKNIRLDLM